MIRMRYRFYGAVQGVGFRYHARYAASLYGVTGYVENLWDGSVYMEAQGTRDAIEKVVETVRNARFVRVEWVEEQQIDPIEGERGFRTRG